MKYHTIVAMSATENVIIIDTIGFALLGIDFCDTWYKTPAEAAIRIDK